MLWSFRCFLLYIASPNQDTASFYCPWHLRKYYPRCVCNTLCSFLHTSEALEQICTLQRFFIEIFLPVSDLLKKALYNLIFPFLKGASVSYKLGWIVMWDCCFFPTPSNTEMSVKEHISVSCSFFTSVYFCTVAVSSLYVGKFLMLTEVLNHRFKSKIHWKNKGTFSLGPIE